MVTKYIIKFLLFIINNYLFLIMDYGENKHYFL